MKRIKFNIVSIFLLTLFAVSSMAQNTHQCTLDCSPYPWSYRLFVSPLITNLTSDQFKSEEKSGLGFNLGGDVVYTFYKKDKLSLNASLGLGITNYNSNRQGDYTNKGWTSEYEQVLNGMQTFYLTETAKGINESQHMTFLDIPVKLGVDYAFTQKWSGFATFGVAYGINLGATYSSTAIVTRTGFYPDYNVLIFDVDVPGSPYYYPTNKAVSGSGKINAQSNLGLEATLGAKYKLNPKMSLYGGVKWMNGLQNVKTSPATTILANTATTLNTLASRNGIVETRALGLELGVQINFGECASVVELSGKVSDSKTKAGVPATIVIKSKGKVIQTVEADKNGNYKVKLPVGQKYQAEVSAPGFVPQTENLNTVGKLVKKDIGLKQAPKTVSLSGKASDAKTAAPAKAKMVIKGNDGEVVKTIEADKNGQFNVDLPKGKVYDVEVSALGYVTQNKTIDLTGDANDVQKDFALVSVKQNVAYAGKATDSKSKAPVKATITVKSNGQPVKTVEADNNGQFNLELPKGKVYDVEVSAPGYAPQQQKVDLTASNKDIQKDFALIPEIQGVQLLAKVVDSKTAAPVEATILVKNYDKVVKSAKADKTGTIKVDVPEGKSYEIEVAATGYVPQRQIVDLTNVPRGVKKEISLDPIVKIEKGLVFKFKNVNFNTGTADLTPEALIVLNMVSTILNENQKLTIDISGHTDNAGKPAANMDLSNRRANSVMNYLISKGAKPAQMKAFGFGQTKPITTNKTVAGKAENRRVEFKVVDM
ncbi:MAG: carboxypeptidase regulatory-like domain-containing protein [Paludibacter sp.]